MAARGQKARPRRHLIHSTLPAITALAADPQCTSWHARSCLTNDRRIVSEPRSSRVARLLHRGNLVLRTSGASMARTTRPSCSLAQGREVGRPPHQSSPALAQAPGLRAAVGRTWNGSEGRINGFILRTFDAYRARVLELPDAIEAASPARREELSRIVVQRVVIRDRRLASIEWVPAVRPFFERQRECPQGDSNP